MKKIITGMGNEILSCELRKYTKYDVPQEDSFCQDVFISKLKKEDVDVIIISGLLQGQWTLEEFVEKIKKVNSTARIIIVTDEIDNTERKILEDYDVLDIFLDSTVEVKDIMDAIDREETIKKKYEMVSEANTTNYDVSTEAAKTDNLVFEKVVQKQEVIAISGNNGSGKSTFAINFCRVLAQKSDSKILLIDLDTLSGHIDDMLNIEKTPQTIELALDADKKSGINYATELIMKNRFDSNVFEELVISSNGFDVLTGNTSLHYCQNVLKTEYYEKILKCAKEKYDFIVLDTSSNIFLDSTKWALEASSKIFYITEGSNVAIKKAEQFIHIITNTWGIWKGKLQVIVNKKFRNDYEDEVISGVVENIPVIGEIKLNEETDSTAYERILEKINYIPKKKLLEKLFDLKNTLFINGEKMERGVAHAN